MMVSEALVTQPVRGARKAFESMHEMLSILQHLKGNSRGLVVWWCPN
jgi:hypothetical protein